MKFLVFLLTFVLIASSAHSQAALLDRDQSSTIIESGLARGHKYTILALGVGATYRGQYDMGIFISKFNSLGGDYWTLGQYSSIEILSETSKDQITSNLSVNQGFSFAQGIRRLSLGATFSIMPRLSRESSVLFSLGYNRSLSLSSGQEGFNTIIIGFTLAIRDRKTLYQISPFATVAEDNRGTYGVALSLSSLTSNRE